MADLSWSDVQPFSIDGRAVGGERCLVIAEAGVNHNGDVNLAHRLIDAAADARADVVKFQSFQPEFVTSKRAERARYQAVNTGSDASQFSLLSELLLPASAYRDLIAHAQERGLLFLSTPFDYGSAQLLAELGMPAFKVASGELTNLPFLESLAKFRRPLLISTGMSTLEEVESAVSAVVENGNPRFALLHCVSNYPTAPQDCNLRSMATMRRRFRAPVGWSDHTNGNAIALAAVAMGAELLEKHLTLSRGLPGPDHAASLEPEEMTELILDIRAVESARGDGVKRPVESEHAIAALVRRSMHATHDLPAGHELTAEDVTALRPAGGIAPSAYRALLGRTLRRPVAADQVLVWDDVE